MKKPNVFIEAFVILITTVFVLFSNNLFITSAVAKEQQTGYEIEIEKNLKDGLKELEIVRQIIPNYLETLAIFEIHTSLIGDDDSSKKIASEIKSRADNILKDMDTTSHFNYYLINVYNHDNENLIDRPVNHSFEKEIKHFGKKLTNKIPQSYTLEDAKKNGDILMGKMRSKKQDEKLKRFEKNVKAGKPDFIRFVQFTMFGDAVITEYQFNGSLIYYRYDSTRDSTKNHQKETPVVSDDYCKELVIDSKMSYITKCYKNDLLEF